MGPKISCICPTYKRPKHLANAIACFEAQDYENKELVVVDDAFQFGEINCVKVTYFSTKTRFPNLPEKFDHAIGMSSGDIICLWEDDDIYLPWHLTAIANAHARGELPYFVSEKVYSTYNVAFGDTQIEGAHGRFHASWAFTRNLYDKCGGYPNTGRLDFDQQMRERLAEHAGGRGYYDHEKGPSYVYRWGNGVYHGSQAGEDGYKRLWDDLGKRPFERIESLNPEFDEETKLIFDSLVN